jgi:cytochrome c oxidase assembly protein Cox11
MSAVVVFLLGYTYAQIPLVQKTCTPSFMDWILK